MTCSRRSVATLGNGLAGDGVAWREISQKLSICTEWKENKHFLVAPALHTNEFACILQNFYEKTFQSYSRNYNKGFKEFVRDQILTFPFKIFTLAKEKKQKPPQSGTFYRCWQPEKAWREIHWSGGRFGAWREIRAFGGRSPVIWREVATLS
jgi:hypothetical protein